MPTLAAAPPGPAITQFDGIGSRSASSSVLSRGLSDARESLLATCRLVRHSVLFRRHWCYHRSPSGSGENVRRVQCDGPDHIGPDHAQHEGDIHKVKERKAEQGVGKKAATHDELQVSRRIHEGIGRPALGVVLPDAQKLLRTSSGEALSLPSNSEEASHRTQEQKTAPQQVSLGARGSPLSNGHSHQKKKVEQIVTDRLEPTTEIRF